MAYTVETRSFDHSRWVCGSNEFLQTAENIENIEGALWIWPTTYTRVYLLKKFNLENITETVAQFKCDNVFDLFINHKPVSLNKKSFTGDITHYLVQGENTVNIRAYQTNDDRFFSSAITGCIKSEALTIVTDQNWLAYRPVSFWENDEPENWQTMDIGPGNGVILITCPIHPRLYKRSLYMRRSFSIDKPIEKATLYVSAAGEAETYINGSRTDNELLSQGISEQCKEYHAIDVTHLITVGENVLGAITANAWLNSESHTEVYMNKNMLICELEITDTEGKTEYIGTDGQWKCNFSPLTDNDLQYGERFDARRIIKGWCEPNFDDSAWANVEVLPTDIEIRKFVLKNYPPIHVMRRVAPVKTMFKDDRIIFDFGENCAGRYRLELNNTTPGQEIKISMCERLDEYGEFIVSLYASVFYNRDCVYNGKSLGCMRNFDFYTCAGGATEVYEPHFTYTGFRYLCVEGATKSQISAIYMNVMRNALKKTGVIKSADYPFAEQLYKTALRSWNGNIMNGPTDCPTREKNFWTGDAQIFTPAACYLEDCDAFLARWTHIGRKICPEVYGWGDEKYIIPWTLYQFYRDKGVLEECYKGIIEFARNRCDATVHHLPNEALSACFSDWLAPDGFVLDKFFFSCCFYCHMLKTVAQIAEVLGDYKTSDEFAALIQPAVDAFNKRFFDPELNNYTPNCQSAIALALAFGLVPVHREKLMAQKLNEMVLKEGHLTTGFVATRYLMNALCDYGYQDTAFMLLDNEKYPSWKHMLKGLTTFPETWIGINDRDADNSVSMNHFSMGAVVAWLFEYLGGIRYRESTPGFSHVVLRPTFIKEMGSFSAELKTVYGLIHTEWKITGNTAVYTFSAERNVTLILPDGTVNAFPAGTHTVTTAL